MGEKDGRSRTSFTEPLELEELESADDPDIFERVTAVPDEVHIPPQATKPKDEDPSSGMFERSLETDSLPPPILTPPNGTPAALGGSWRPNTRLDAARTTPPGRLPFEIDLSEVVTEPPPAAELEALEAVLPTRDSVQRSSGESPLLSELRGRYATGDFSGALTIAERDGVLLRAARQFCDQHRKP